MAFDPTQLEIDLSIYGVVQDMNYDDISLIIFMTNVSIGSLSDILNVMQNEAVPYYPTCVNFGYSANTLKMQYINEVVLPPANNDEEPAN